MERASWNIKNGTSMAGSFVGQRGPREQMRIGGCEEEDREERRRTEKGAVQEYLLASLPPVFPLLFVFDAPNSLVVRLVSTGEIRRLYDAVYVASG